jgi:hypothetical protein
MASLLGYPANAAISIVVSINAGLTRTEHAGSCLPMPGYASADALEPEGD